MAKTIQVMTISIPGGHYVCILDHTSKINPYKLYTKWYDCSTGRYGWHKKKIAEYADFDSVLYHILQLRCQA